MDNFYTVSEAAEKLGLAPKTLRRWEDAGRFRPQRTVGGQRRYSVEDIQILDAIKSDIIPSQSDLLTVEQAANLFGVTPQTIVRWDNEGKIHSLITSNNSYYSKTNLSSKIQALKAPEPAPYYSTPSPAPQEIDLNAPPFGTPPTYSPPHYHPSTPEHTPAQYEHPTPPPPPPPPHIPTPQILTDETIAHTDHTSDLPRSFTSFFLPAIVINLVLTISLILGYHTLITKQSDQGTEGEVKGAVALSTAVEEILSSMVDTSGNLSVPGRISTKESLFVSKHLTLSPILEPTPIPGTLYYDSSSETLRFFTNNSWHDLGSSSLSLESASAEIGKSTLTKDTSSEKITNSLITPDSSVMITFNTDYAPARKYWTEIGSGFFTLHTDFPVGQDTSFTYIIFSSLDNEPENNTGSLTDPSPDTSPSLDINDAIIR